MTGTDIKALRQQIDQTDARILDLINQRLRFAQQIGKIKEGQGTAIVDTERESQLIDRLVRLNQGPLSRSNLYHIFKEIITVSRQVQVTELTRYLGPGDTDVYAVIGNPVSHSLSPAMHGMAFFRRGINAVYVPLEVVDIEAAAAAIKALNIKGVSVTIPHKVAIRDHLDEIDPTAAAIGAVNTIQQIDGRLHGYNSDWLGAVRALRAVTDIKNRSVMVVGAGGAARAIGYGIRVEGGRLTIVNRNPKRGEALAADLNADYRQLSGASTHDIDILINTTPVGMIPDTEAAPIADDRLHAGLTVMDIIYNPLKTRLLKAAESIGCRVISGVDMFVHQGAFQFELWTGETAPVDIMKDAVMTALQRV